MQSSLARHLSKKATLHWFLGLESSEKRKEFILIMHFKKWSKFLKSLLNNKRLKFYVYFV